jgi:hypothetical protein
MRRHSHGPKVPAFLQETNRDFPTSSFARTNGEDGTSLSFIETAVSVQISYSYSERAPSHPDRFLLTSKPVKVVRVPLGFLCRKPRPQIGFPLG